MLSFKTSQFSWVRIAKTSAVMICLIFCSINTGGSAAEAFADLPQNRPNIVVFLSDDHTCRDSSTYGSTEISTPSMDRLAEQGMTFDRAFVASPSCAPSRAALLTGLMPARNGAEANHSRPQKELRKLPDYFHELGYEVVAFGKVGHYAQTPEYGFDVARHFGYHEDIAVEKAVEWLKDRNDTRPVCLFVGTNWPHVPWPEESTSNHDVVIPQNHIDTPETRLARSRYEAAVRRMDHDLGRILSAVDEFLPENTLFLHTSDHGGQWPFGKWTLYEDGIRTPLIVRWPGHIAPGVRSSAMVSWVDILPTLFEAAGGEPDSSLDGKSFLKVLTGQQAQHRSEIFTTHSGDGNFNVYPMRSIRTDRWKYIRNLHPEFEFTSHVTKVPEGEGYWPSWLAAANTSERVARQVEHYRARPPEELYDLTRDPLEQNNLATCTNLAGTLSLMRGRLAEWMREQHDTETVFGNPEFLPQTKHPNIITILIDDLGWSDLGCFGGTDAKTPHIDQLAAEGIQFRNFYVNSPICSPSRTAFVTGQYPARHRITSFLSNRAENTARGMAQWLDVQAPVLARALHASGYATGHFGKWHLGGQRDVGEAPLITDYGFDESLTNFEGLGPRILPLKNAFDGKQPTPHALGSDQLGRGPIEWEDRSLISRRFVDRAIEFLVQASGAGKPAYINLWPDDVHSPFFPPQNLRGDGSKRTLYCGVLEQLDSELKRLFDHIRENPNLRSNTLIVLASDNGPEPGAGQSRTLRGHKGELWEGGIRSPLIVWGPGLIEEEATGTVNNTTILSSVDLVSSLVELTGAQFPEGYTSDGENLLGALLGKSAGTRSQPIFWRRPPDRPSTEDRRRPDLAVRDGQWKCVCNLDGSAPELYDLNDDPGEKQNLADKRPRITSRLVTAMLNWNKSLPRDGVQPAAEQNTEIDPDKFVNPVAEGADPWVIRDPFEARYLWCMSDGNRGIALWSSPTLTSLGERHLIWQAPDSGPNSREVWAPELHLIGEHWYVYFAASDGRNENHLAWVLKSKTTDALGEWTLHGPFATGDGPDGRTPNIWAIDMTVLEHKDQLFAIWSGWDAPGTDRQFLYIAPMKTPTELAGPRVRLCNNSDFLWERTEEREDSRGLHEGPQVLKRGERTFVLYSTAASWLPTYKLGMLELVGDNPLDPASWKKFNKPVFESTDTVYGVGHSCFVDTGDDQWWHVFHAKQDRNPGWRRSIYIQPFQFTPEGTPNFGQPQPGGQPVPKPPEIKKDPENGKETASLPCQRRLRAPESLSSWNYYGHHQLMRQDSEGVHLGAIPVEPINVYRCGEKLVLSNPRVEDFEASVTVRFVEGDRDAGLLFRVTGPSVGYDAQRGYFAGIVPGTQLLIVGRMDGVAWKELGRTTILVDRAQPQRLTVRCQGQQIVVTVNDKTRLELTDSTWKSGLAGLRVVDTHAVFSDFELTALP